MKSIINYIFIICIILKLNNATNYLTEPFQSNTKFSFTNELGEGFHYDIDEISVSCGFEHTCAIESRYLLILIIIINFNFLLLFIIVIIISYFLLLNRIYIYNIYLYLVHP